VSRAPIGGGEGKDELGIMNDGEARVVALAVVVMEAGLPWIALRARVTPWIGLGEVVVVMGNSVLGIQKCRNWEPGV
jgi:hypothetical protein